MACSITHYTSERVRWKKSDFGKKFLLPFLNQFFPMLIDRDHAGDWSQSLSKSSWTVSGMQNYKRRAFCSDAFCRWHAALQRRRRGLRCNDTQSIKAWQCHLISHLHHNPPWWEINIECDFFQPSVIVWFFTSSNPKWFISAKKIDSKSLGL